MKPKRIKLKIIGVKREPIIGSTISSTGFIAIFDEGRVCTEEVMLDCPSFEAEEYASGMYTCKYIECSVCFNIPE
jgi:hypothetical protein